MRSLRSSANPYLAKHQALRRVYDPAARKVVVINLAGDPIAMLRYGQTALLTDKQVITAREFRDRWSHVHAPTTLRTNRQTRIMGGWLAGHLGVNLPPRPGADRVERPWQPHRPNLWQALERAAGPDFALVRAVCCFDEPPKDWAELRRLQKALDRVAAALKKVDRIRG